MSATDLEISNLRREIEKLRYVQIEILEELQKFNAFIETQQKAQEAAKEELIRMLAEEDNI